MQSSLSWIEWLDRLDRVLKGAREDARALAGLETPRAVAAVERCTRQLAALTQELRLLDRSVVAAGSAGASTQDRAQNLQKALDTTVFHLETMANAPGRESHGARERLLTAVESALRDSSYEAAMLVRPRRQFAEARVN
jgi:S-adenosylhomocysteine hydrolase